MTDTPEYKYIALKSEEWRIIQRAVRHYGHYLVRRAARRVRSEPGNADQREIDCLRTMATLLANAAGTRNDEGFV